VVGRRGGTDRLGTFTSRQETSKPGGKTKAIKWREGRTSCIAQGQDAIGLPSSTGTQRGIVGREG